MTEKVSPEGWQQILKQYGISERQWRESLDSYERLGGKVLPPYAILDASWDLIQQDKLQEAVDKLSSHYRIETPPVVRKEARNTVFGGKRAAGEYERGQIILYPRAFEKDKSNLAGTVYHEFAHHLQNCKYPFTGKVGELHEKDRKYTFMHRELFTMAFQEGCLQRLGFAIVGWKRPD